MARQIDNPKVRGGGRQASRNPALAGAQNAIKNNPALSGAKEAIGASLQGPKQMRGSNFRDFPRLVHQVSGGGNTPGNDNRQRFDHGSLTAPSNEPNMSSPGWEHGDDNADENDTGQFNPGTPEGHHNPSGTGVNLFPNRQMNQIVHLIHQAVADGNLTDDERDDIEAARSLLMNRASQRASAFRGQVAKPTSMLHDQLQKRVGGLNIG